MISPYAVEDFLKRKMKDSAIYKKMSAERIDELFAKYVGKVRTKTPLRQHQKVSAMLGCKYDRYLYLLDMGLGKSLTSLVTVMAKNPKRTLICVPSVANIGAWVDEIMLRTPHLTVAGVTGTPKRRHAAMFGSSKIIIVTYMGLLSFCCSRVPIGKRKTKMMVDSKKIAALSKHFECIICDEITKACEPTSATFKVLRFLSPAMKYFYGLTGTLFGRDATDLWGQFYLVDLGETFGKTLGLFREAFFSKKPRYFGGFDYKLRKRRKPILMRWLRNRSIRYETAECVELPPVSYITKRCELAASAEKLYDNIALELQAAKKNHVLAESSFIRMRQLTGGFVTLKGREKTEDRIEIILKQNPKLDLLLEVIEEIPKDSKVLIFHQFKTSGALISEALTKAGHKNLRLYSGTKRKDEVVREFDKRKDIKHLVGSSTAAYGLNIQSANYVIFYESPVDSRERLQMEKRAHRVGQTKKVFFIDLVARGTVDERIRQFNNEGKNLLREVVDGKVSLERKPLQLVKA